MMGEGGGDQMGEGMGDQMGEGMGGRGISRVSKTVS